MPVLRLVRGDEHDQCLHVDRDQRDGLSGVKAPGEGQQATRGGLLRCVGVADCIYNQPGLQSAHFSTTLTASIAALRTGLCATETAIIRAGQQWIAAGQHYLQLTRGLAYALPADACWPTVSVRYTLTVQGG